KSPSPKDRQNPAASAVMSTTWLSRVSSEISADSIAAVVPRQLTDQHDLRDERGSCDRCGDAVSLVGRGDDEAAPHRRGGELARSGQDELVLFLEVVRAPDRPEGVVHRALTDLVHTLPGTRWQDGVRPRAAERALTGEVVRP